MLLVTAAFASPATSASAQNDPSTELPAQLLAQHRAAQSICEPIDELVHGTDWRVRTLTNDFVLYMVPCAAGAYNFSHVLYVGYAGSDLYSRLLLVDFTDRYGWVGVDQLYGVAFDEQTLTLTSHYKGRGLGDCGTAGSWVWDEYAFRLEAFFAKGECDGIGEPGDFPQIWPPD